MQERQDGLSLLASGALWQSILVTLAKLQQAGK